MAFFRSVSSADTLPPIDGQGVVLRSPQMGDFAEWAALREHSRDFLAPWEPTWPADDLTRGAFRRACGATPRTCAPTRPTRSSVPQGRQGPGRRPDARQVRRGVAQAGSLGYWMGAPYARQGYMTAAVRALILRVRRAAAAPPRGGLHPDQQRLGPPARASRLWPRGLARPDLCINGVWQDHLLYARLHSKKAF